MNFPDTWLIPVFLAADTPRLFSCRTYLIRGSCERQERISCSVPSVEASSTMINSQSDNVWTWTEAIALGKRVSRLNVGIMTETVGGLADIAAWSFTLGRNVSTVERPFGRRLLVSPLERRVWSQSAGQVM